ncbi:MAG: alpha/beta hydrolase-fold protein [Saprospiraceae bacterium]
MKKCLFFLFLWMTNISFAQVAGNALIPVERHSLTSNYLQEERFFQIYLPPNYHFNPEGNYPVVYLIDGDYNFQYDTGLIELLSNVSGVIPEMIVVGISDKGSTKYRKNCTPTGQSKKEGNATNYMAFIEQELKPYIQKNYRSSAYDILVGHSMGGLFVTNYLLEQPAAFDTYIAIDPSLWIGEYEIIQRADSLLNQRKTLGAKFFISLANTKEMGVRQFVGVLDKYFPLETDWNFEYYKNETHGSVGLITIKDALQKLFKDWHISRQKFYSFKSAQEVLNHYKKFSTAFATRFNLPANDLGNFVYYYFRKGLTKELKFLETEIATHFPGSLDDFRTNLARNHLEKGELKIAEKIYRERIAANPLSFQSYGGLAKIFALQKDFPQAKQFSKKSLEIAQQVKVRQWLLNELESKDEEIQMQAKK